MYNVVEFRVCQERLANHFLSGLDHSADPEEIEDLSRFLRKIIPEQGEKL